MSIRLIIADDHTLFRAGLIKLLESQKNIRVVGEAKSGKEALSMLQKTSCDLLIADIAMSPLNGFQLLEKIKSLYPTQKVLFLSAYKNLEYCKHFIRHGAFGYLPKEDTFEHLIHAINTIVKGKKYVSPSLKKMIVAQYLGDSSNQQYIYPDILTKTEINILRFIGAGLSNKEISRKLNISIRTAETHRSHILKKLGCKNTAQLVQYSIAYKLIPLPDVLPQ